MSPVSDLPPPSGKPVAYALIGDPWAEQARRHEAHRVAQRRRRRRVALRSTGVLGVVAVAGVAAFFVVGTEDSGERSSETIGTAAATAAAGDGATEVVPTLLAGTSVVVSDNSQGRSGEVETAQVIDVWLLDRGDGSYGWGAVLASRVDVVRGDLDVSMVARDGDGVPLFDEQLTVPRLVPGSTAAVGGVFEVDEGTPTRLEVTATLGTALPDEVGAVFIISDVRRVASGQIDRDDRLLGTVELVSGDGAAIRLAAIWRDEDGSVVASVFDELDPIEAGAAADFSLRLPRNLVPPGEPDTIVPSVGSSD